MKFFSTRSLLTILATVTALWCFAWQANATLVTNPGFESPATGIYSFLGGAPTGWTATGNGSVGVQYWPSLWTYGVPDGNQYLYANNLAGVQQVLSTPIEAQTTYTLGVWVGARTGYTVAPAYTQVGLTFDNGTVVPTPDASSSPALVDSQFVLWTRSYYVPADGIVNGLNVIGKNITIGLANLDPGAFNQTSFDLVTLDVVGVPEPTTVTLLLAGGAIVAALRSRRTR